LAGSVIMLSAALVWVVAGTLEAPVVNVGDSAPKFAISTDAGRTLTRSDFGGKLLVLNFWATWCPPCIEEIPSLDAFQRTLGPEGVVVLGISVDRNEKLYRRFLDQRHVSFQTARDPEAEISASYGTFQYPETYIIDRSGKVVQKIISNQNWMDPEFLASVRRLL